MGALGGILLLSSERAFRNNSFSLAFSQDIFLCGCDIWKEGHYINTTLGMKPKNGGVLSQINLKKMELGKPDEVCPSGCTTFGYPATRVNIFPSCLSQFLLLEARGS